MAGEKRDTNQQADRSICLWIAGFWGQPFCDGVRYSLHFGSLDVVHGCWSFLEIEPFNRIISFGYITTMCFWDLKLFTMIHVFFSGVDGNCGSKYHDCGETTHRPSN